MAVTSKVRKAKAQLTQEHVHQLMRGEKLIISLKDGQTQLQLELTTTDSFRTLINKQIDDAMKALDEAVDHLEKVVTSKETQGIFKSLNKTITKIFDWK
jgi:hypothetical protein